MKPIFLSLDPNVPPDSYWDQSFLKDILKECESDRQIFVVPGAYQGHLITQINKKLAKHKKVLVFITSDEERKFDETKLTHPDMILYVQYGKTDHPFPLGYTPDTVRHVKVMKNPTKTLPWFFSGQVTTDHRKDMYEHRPDGGICISTEGFARGIPHKEYIEYMTQALVCPCPNGTVSPDSFRLYEALESGSVPILLENPYWSQLFPTSPIPILSSWNQLKKAVEMYGTQEYANKVFSWWQQEKQKIKNRLRKELNLPQPATTIVITTSPIPSHPKTDIIEETIKSIRHYYNNEIVILIDGIRKEQEDKRSQYTEYIKNLLWKCNFEYENIIPVVFEQHKHQSGMVRWVLEYIDTPLVLFVEHDTPLTTDLTIPFSTLEKYILSGKSNLIRFHYEAHIPEEHKYLMLGEVEDNLQKTAQWSQRPHLARTDLYRNIMQYFSHQSNCFIEDRIYGQLYEACKNEGEAGWERWKTHIYHPRGVIKRSLNLDGRKNDRKFDDQQIW